MKTTLPFIFFSVLSACQSRCQSAPDGFEFAGFRLGMAKKDLGAMSSAMRPWKPVGMMDARKDEWTLTPARLAAPPPPFPKLSGIYTDKPLIHGVKLAWTNGTLCKITVEGPMAGSHAKARDWAAAAQEVVGAALGKPEIECAQMGDRSGESLLAALREAGAVGAFWPNARVIVFRWSDDSPAGFAGKIMPSFEVSAQKLPVASE